MPTAEHRYSTSNTESQAVQFPNKLGARVSLDLTDSPDTTEFFFGAFDHIDAARLPQHSRMLSTLATELEAHTPDMQQLRTEPPKMP